MSAPPPPPPSFSGSFLLLFFLLFSLSEVHSGDVSGKNAFFPPTSPSSPANSKMQGRGETGGGILLFSPFYFFSLRRKFLPNHLRDVNFRNACELSPFHVEGPVYQFPSPIPLLRLHTVSIFTKQSCFRYPLLLFFLSRAKNATPSSLSLSFLQGEEEST